MATVLDQINTMPTRLDAIGKSLSASAAKIGTLPAEVAASSGVGVAYQEAATEHQAVLTGVNGLILQIPLVAMNPSLLANITQDAMTLAQRISNLELRTMEIAEAIGVARGAGGGFSLSQLPSWAPWAALAGGLYIVSRGRDGKGGRGGKRGGRRKSSRRRR